MTRVAAASVLLALLTGCASNAGAWRTYARGSYQYGRIEAKAELICAPPRNPALADFCREAADTQKQVRALVPILETELEKGKPDFSKIMQYIDLVLSLASKAL